MKFEHSSRKLLDEYQREQLNKERNKLESNKWVKKDKKFTRKMDTHQYTPQEEEKDRA